MCEAGPQPGCHSGLKNPVKYTDIAYPLAHSGSLISQDHELARRDPNLGAGAGTIANVLGTRVTAGFPAPVLSRSTSTADSGTFHNPLR
jgi:hypothetical protein